MVYQMFTQAHGHARLLNEKITMTNPEEILSFNEQLAQDYCNLAEGYKLLATIEIDEQERLELRNKVWHFIVAAAALERQERGI